MNYKGLNEYIRQNKDKPFRFKENDCLTFTNEVWEVLYGFKWSGDWLGRYSAWSRPDALKKEYGFNTLEEAIDTKLTRFLGVPPRGALVITTKSKNWSTGKALGISVGHSGLFLREVGLVSLPIEDIDMAWVNNE